MRRQEYVCLPKPFNRVLDVVFPADEDPHRTIWKRLLKGGHKGVIVVDSTGPCVDTVHDHDHGLCIGLDVVFGEHLLHQGAGQGHGPRALFLPERIPLVPRCFRDAELTSEVEAFRVVNLTLVPVDDPCGVDPATLGHERDDLVPQPVVSKEDGHVWGQRHGEVHQPRELVEVVGGSHRVYGQVVRNLIERYEFTASASWLVARAGAVTMDGESSSAVVRHARDHAISIEVAAVHLGHKLADVARPPHVLIPATLRTLPSPVFLPPFVLAVLRMHLTGPASHDGYDDRVPRHR
mmetsp:Transcript_66208/g.182735  ORF Transcript_66208/g.182735 Transcript_66208/m.182735 type:complete len:293 (-) Transcript_66208:303-1181(-)